MDVIRSREAEPGEPVWKQHGPPLPSSSSVPTSADVVILGAGLTGAAAALTLVRQGVAVVVLDAGALMDGASARNGGQVLTGTNLSYPDLLSRLGPDAAQAVYRETLEAVDAVARLADALGDGEWHRGGHLALARDDRHAELLQREAAALRKHGHPVTWWDAERVRAALGFGRWVGALYDPRSGTVNPFRLGAALIRAAADRGAVFVPETPGRIRRRTGGLTVETPRGSIRAPAVLVAVNAWLSDVLPAWSGRVRRIWGHVAATDPLPLPFRDRVLPDRPCAFEESDRYVYFQKTADGRLVLGGRGPGPGDAAARLRRLLRDLMPELPDTLGLTVWSGPLAIVRDGLPRVGYAPPGVYWVGGYSGHGVALAVGLGRRMADWIVTGRAPVWPNDLPPLWLPDRVAPFRRWRIARIPKPAWLRLDGFRRRPA